MGYQVQPSFSIGLHRKDLALLESIKEYFGNGTITKSGKDCLLYRVVSINRLRAVVDHFDKYPLITQKRADYELFKSAIEVLSTEDITTERVQKLVNLRASINRGLSHSLKTAFPNTIPVLRSELVDHQIKDPNWVAGFASGEGSFFIGVDETPKSKVGARVYARFQVSQHSRDEVAMKSLMEYLGCGQYYHYLPREAGDLVVSKLSDITTKIIPFFHKHPIEGVKALDFADFCKVVELMKNKAHLTQSGLEEIRLIKAGMNKGRNS